MSSVQATQTTHKKNAVCTKAIPCGACGFVSEGKSWEAHSPESEKNTRAIPIYDPCEMYRYIRLYHRRNVKRKKEFQFHGIRGTTSLYQTL